MSFIFRDEWPWVSTSGPATAGNLKKLKIRLDHLGLQTDPDLNADL